MPSLWEAGPYALLEAMAAGVPVVGARIPGIIDWVTEGQTGYLVEPANAASLARGLVSALTGPREARRRAEAARGMVLERNTKDRWLRDMAALYESIVSAPG
jgi:glycosyltransferase involved in cell wall biosynthesis